jgi:HSP20 family protein
MTIIRRTSPFGEISSFRNAIDRLFDETTFRPVTWGGSPETRLPLDISSSEDAIAIEAALPGIRPEDVELTVHQDTLTISVKESEEEVVEEGTRVYREVRRSRGSRTLTLPSGLDVDAANATFENGMLRLTIPRAEQAKPRQISISAISDGTAPVATAALGSTQEASAEDADKD